MVAAAYSRGDRDAWNRLVDPEIEVVPPSYWPEPATVRGADQAWRFYSDFDEIVSNDDAPYEVTHSEPVGEGLVICMEAPKRIPHGDTDLGFRMWAAVAFRRGRVARFEWFRERDEAAAAARAGRPTR